jgi:hypothetical protein
MWVPPEDKDPIVYHAPTRSSVALFGAVNVRTGQLVAMLISQFDADTFEAFLGHLLGYRSRSRRMVVILDNARYHQAEQTTVFVTALHRLFDPVSDRAAEKWKENYACDRQSLLHSHTGTPTPLFL